MWRAIRSVLAMVVFISPLRLCFGNEQRAWSFPLSGIFITRVNRSETSVRKWVCNVFPCSPFYHPIFFFSPHFPLFSRAVIRSIIIIANVINIATSRHIMWSVWQMSVYIGFVFEKHFPSISRLFVLSFVSLSWPSSFSYSFLCDLGNEQSTIQTGTA